MKGAIRAIDAATRYEMEMIAKIDNRKFWKRWRFHRDENGKLVRSHPDDEIGENLDD